MNINNFAFVGGTCDMDIAETEVDGIELTAEVEQW